MPLPQFLCIGAQKAATSWLYVNLARHKQIWMPPVKELHYFNHLFVPENRNWTQYHMRQGVAGAIRHHLKTSEYVDFAYMKYLVSMMDELFTEKWYRGAFDFYAGRNKIIGDITPEYSTIPDEGIDYVRQLLGGVKLIYIIRDPVSRAMSQLRINLDRHPKSSMGEKDWIEAATSWDILNRGDYKTYIPRWKKKFAEKDILFIPFRQVSDDPEKTLKDLERFLKLEPFDNYRDASEKVHETKQLAVPAYVKPKLEEVFKDQYAFLAEEFGKDFVARI